MHWCRWISGCGYNWGERASEFVTNYNIYNEKCDPPYYNSDCGHYDGYSVHDFEKLLQMLASIEGKFLLSSYPSEILEKYTKANGWYQRRVEQQTSVNKGKGKLKVECMTANYEI